MTDPIRGLFEPLEKLAHNFWWAWQPEVMTIFRDLDPVLWTEVDHNPVLLLRRLDRDTVLRRARELAIERRVIYALRRLEDYQRGEDTYGVDHAGPILARPVAYFSAEFGLHESLPLYSGGLGILAGDHLKSASDLGLPLVGVGLPYQTATSASASTRRLADGEVSGDFETCPCRSSATTTAARST